MKRFGLIATVGLMVMQGLPALAQVEELPAFAYDMVSEITFASTADAKCDGIKTRPAKLQSYIVDMYGKLADEGISATDAAKHFETSTANEQIALRDGALRSKHGVGAEGIDALCAAVRAEAAANRDFAKLLRIR